ncbi:GNAT family N-acetyltransferase [Propionibacteriaceae bacterium Y1923]|uniref:GNAT family N-acetyltransferase n=1 Tax=Aestuariimicrobium sp. Y1814 TaxID=3418742 RepID=UPI003C245389
MSQGLAEVFPPLGLRITCGPLVLRGITDELIMPLVEVARRGVHNQPPELTPLANDWTTVPAPMLAINYAKWAWNNRLMFSADSWILALAVEYDGELVGVQEGKGEKFRANRSISTGSWLGRAAHGRGIGTLMRQAYCTFAIDHLGAQEMLSEAFVDNPASTRVSEKVGYRRTGSRPAQRAGAEVGEAMYRLVPDDLVRPPYPLEVEGLEPLLRFLGLDGSTGNTAEVA